MSARARSRGRDDLDDGDLGPRAETDPRHPSLHSDAAVDVEPGRSLAIEPRFVALPEARQGHQRAVPRQRDLTAVRVSGAVEVDVSLRSLVDQIGVVIQEDSEGLRRPSRERRWERRFIADGDAADPDRRAVHVEGRSTPVQLLDARSLERLEIAPVPDVPVPLNGEGRSDRGDASHAVTEDGEALDRVDGVAREDDEV